MDGHNAVTSRKEIGETLEVNGVCCIHGGCIKFMGEMIESCKDAILLCTGPVGCPGKTGKRGAPGADGADGAPGADGADGAPGADGADGADGVVTVSDSPEGEYFPMVSYDQSTGTLYHSGAVEHWEDIRIYLTATGKGNNSPTEILFVSEGQSFSKIFSFFFDVNASRTVFGIVQLPHEWVEGTTIYPHIHFSPNRDGQDSSSPGTKAVIEYEFSVQNEAGGVFPSSSKYYTHYTASPEDSNGSNLTLQLNAGNGTGNGQTMTGKTISCIILFSLTVLTRLDAESYTGESFTSTYYDNGSGLFIHEIDWHYQSDGHSGSHYKVTKTI